MSWSKRIHLSCEECDHGETFDTPRVGGAEASARRAGWKIVPNGHVCPDCVNRGGA